jgi:hypothetical protein
MNGTIKEHQTANQQLTSGNARGTGTTRFGHRVFAAAVLVGATVVALPAWQSSSPHSYFDALVSRNDHWKSYSLRSPAQLARPADRGYASSNSDPLMVTYAPSSDDDPHAQDAAKVVIPAFQPGPVTMLAAPIGPTSMTLPLSSLGGDVTKVTTSFNAKGRQIRIGNEVIITNEAETPLDRATGLVTVSKRGAYGTTAASHSAGDLVAIGGNSLANQVRVPVQTYDGATWMITWDAYFTDSYLNNGIGNFKAFQLSSDNAIWVEPQIHFSGDTPRPAAFSAASHVGVTGRIRSYNRLGGPADYSLASINDMGPGVTNNNPVLPAGPGAPTGPFFVLHPNRWTRWWIRIEQRANDYDVLDAWMADEQTGPVQVYNGVPVSVRNTNGVPTIDEFWVEFNTSTAYLPPGRTTDFRDLVAYVRNVVVLRDPPADVNPLLLRPGATASLPRPPGPAAPRNLRSISALLEFLSPASTGD